MEISIDEDVLNIKPITVAEFNVAQINSIDDKYKELRSKSKAPSFALTLVNISRYMAHSNEQLWFH